MNFIKSTFIVLTGGLLFTSCNKEAKEAITAKTEKNTRDEAKPSDVNPTIKKEILAANLKTTSFTIEGMTCAIGCAKTIQEELSDLDGVQSATVDFDKKLATVIFDKTIQTPETLTKIVQATGDGNTYKVSKLSQSF